MSNNYTSIDQLYGLREIPLNTHFIDEYGEEWTNIVYSDYAKRYLEGSFGHIYGIYQHKFLKLHSTRNRIKA